jgi:hypothetical protein
MDKQAGYLWMADIYTKAASGGTIQRWTMSGGEFHWSSSFVGNPTLLSGPDNWRIKPVLKVIDLTPLIGSGLDCTFTDPDRGYTHSGPLKRVHDYASITKFEDVSRCHWTSCQPRMSPHIHYWGGGEECPVPEGFEMKIHFRNGRQAYVGAWLPMADLRWRHDNGNSDIIGIELIAVIDTYTLSAQ